MSVTAGVRIKHLEDEKQNYRSTRGQRSFRKTSSEHARTDEQTSVSLQIKSVSTLGSLIDRQPIIIGFKIKSLNEVKRAAWTLR